MRSRPVTTGMRGEGSTRGAGCNLSIAPTLQRGSATPGTLLRP
jgi:hypothetical protein